MKPPLFTMVEFSLSGLCNRHCEFCPRYDPNIYPNKDEFFPADLYTKVADELHRLDFGGLIVYSGFSEPFLHKRLEEFVKIARIRCPKAQIKINTNGDFLNTENLKALFKAGLSSIQISLYDGPHTIPRFESMRKKLGLSETQFILRSRYLPREQDFGLILSNRAGMVSPHLGIPTENLPLKRNCYYPFYIVMIDHNGDILLCSHDWGKKLIVCNIRNMTLIEAWESPMMDTVRKRLHNKDRDFGPCKHCSVNGLLQGQAQYNAWPRNSTTCTTSGV